LLGHDPAGRCVFFEAPLCAIHRDLGHGALPLACRQFPRVSLLGPASVSISLSHYCPTAAALLFEATGPTTIVTGAPRFPARGEYDGLDVRGAWPPMLRPGVLTSAASHARFEARAVELLTRDAFAVTHAVASLTATTEALARWTPEKGDWEVFAVSVLAEPVAPAALHDTRSLWDAVVAAVPDSSRRPSFLSPPGADRELFDSPEWPLAGPVKRYLAAKCFASWSAYQGEGLRTTARLIEAALAVLQVESARRADGPLERAALVEAVRRSDLLLVHLADPAELARRLDALPEG